MSLFALVLSLGLLVDTFIVILEGIFHNIKKGRTSKEASLLSVAHYRKPLTSGILTTISAFVPMLLVSGILGEFLKVLPITISITLFSSLFVSLVIVPSISALFLRKSKFREQNKDSILEKFLTKRLMALYKKNICKFLKNRKQKIGFAIITVLLFLSSLGLLIGGVIPVKLFPLVDIDFAYINIEMPVGTDLRATERVVRKVEAELFDYPNIDNFVTTIGQVFSFDFISTSGGEHLASININFVPKEEREIKSFEIVEELRERMKKISEGKITVTELSAGPPTGAPIEARILGGDLIILDKLTDNVIDVLENTEGVINIISSKEISPADLIFKLNKESLAKYRLSVPEVSSFLRTAIFGVTATEISVEGDDVDVVVKLDRDKASSIEDIKNLSIISSFGSSVKLSQIADFELSPALATIRHRDLERTAIVKADLSPGFSPAAVVPEAEKEVINRGIPAGYTINFGGEVEDIEQSFSELWNAMIVAVLLILIILVVQFNSFIKPFVILMVLPLTLIGVVVGMLLLDLDFSFSVFLGLVSLSGIVVNDAIVLLDKTKRNVVEKGLTPREAVADAGEKRLQPILLTSITTIIGVIPLAIANEFWYGLSVSIAFGLAFATILQLFVVPMLYLQFEGKAEIKRMKEEAE